MLGVIYLLRAPVAERLSAPYRDLFVAMWPRPPGTPLAVVMSLLLGIWTHLLWDTFTHNHGWLVERVTVLQTPLFEFRGRAFRISHLISYACSFAGVALLFAAAAKRREESVRGVQKFNKCARRKLFWIAGLVLPINAIHYLVPSIWGLCLVATLSFFMLAAAAKVLGGEVR
jgi:uncharacterized membrane protein YhaH (DUF805 family)